MKTIYLLVVTSIFIACKESSEKTAPIQKEEFSKLTSETYRMLQGTWVNKDDTLSTIRFDGNISKNFYKGIDSGKEIFFTVDSNCATSETVAPALEGKYINTTGVAEECYFIETLNETDFTMKLVSEGILLQFRRK